MKFRIISLIWLIIQICSTFSLSAQSKTWSYDPDYSSMIFSISHLHQGRVNGSVAKFSIKMIADKPDFSDSKLRFSIDTKTISTNNPVRDSSIRGSNFLNVEKNPTIDFESNKIEIVDKGNYNIYGHLTMNSITRPIMVHLEYKGTEFDPEIDRFTSIFILTTVINRVEFGLGSGKQGIIGNYIQFIADFEVMED